MGAPPVFPPTVQGNVWGKLGGLFTRSCTSPELNTFVYVCNWQVTAHLEFHCGVLLLPADWFLHWVSFLGATLLQFYLWLAPPGLQLGAHLTLACQTLAGALLSSFKKDHLLKKKENRLYTVNLLQFTVPVYISLYLALTLLSYPLHHTTLPFGIFTLYSSNFLAKQISSKIKI